MRAVSHNPPPPSPIGPPRCVQELKKPIMMFPNYALRNSIEEWAGEHAPIILGPDGHVLESEPEPEDASPAARPTQNPPGAAAVVGNPLRAQPGQDSHNSRTQVEGAERRSRNPNSWLNTGLVVREMFVPLCCILMASLQVRTSWWIRPEVEKPRRLFTAGRIQSRDRVCFVVE